MLNNVWHYFASFMSVNISVASLQPRVGKPLELSLETQKQCFPKLVLESGWGYYMVTKSSRSQREIHCLRIPEHKCCNIIGDMQWYCKLCGRFPCQWRARGRHLKKCTPSPLVPSENYLYYDYMSVKDPMNFYLDEEFALFCQELGELNITDG